jgi:hypothetical protein
MNNKDSVDLKIKLRPFSSGDVDTGNIKAVSKLGKRSEARNAGDIDTADGGDYVVRPRAPRTRLPITKLDSSTVKSSVTAIVKSSAKRTPKPQNLADQWDSLNHFGRNNAGRHLGTEQTQQPNEIHYINLHDNESDDLRSSSPKNNDENAPFMRKQDPIENMKGGVGHYPNSAFIIPELPQGKLLQFNILSTWGDPHYLGLMGIEIFDSSGHSVKLSNPDSQIWADPADINVLPDYTDDPRTVDNLVDGVNHTSDDLHAWLTPFTMGEDHLITINLDEETTISMIRIWNYNKSRIHSYRGARYVEINFIIRGCMIPIFKGEIKRAIGTHSSSVLETDACSECILFTRNENILALIEKYDPIFVLARIERKKEEEQQLFTSFSKQHLSRGSNLNDNDENKANSLSKSGKCASAQNVLSEYKQAVEALRIVNGRISSPAKKPIVHDRRLISASVDLWTANDNGPVVRPTTGKGGRTRSPSIENEAVTIEIINKDYGIRPSSALAVKGVKAVKGSSIHVCALSTWGYPGLIGVTGMSGIDQYVYLYKYIYIYIYTYIHICIYVYTFMYINTPSLYVCRYEWYRSASK